MTASPPPGGSASRSAGSATASPSSSRFTAIRIAWKIRAKSSGPDRGPSPARIALTRASLIAKGARPPRRASAPAGRRARGPPRGGRRRGDRQESEEKEGGSDRGVGGEGLGARVGRFEVAPAALAEPGAGR